MNPLLTVAVPALAERFTSGLPSSVRDLFAQAHGMPVEVKCLLDNGVQTLSEKRNEAAEHARGTFLSFVDDDDAIESDYIEAIVDAIKAHPAAHVIVFDVKVSGYGRGPSLCRYGLGFSHGEDHVSYYRRPNHVMAWRTNIVREEPYKNVVTEDTEWATEVSRRLELSEARIDKVLYHYQYNPWTTTQGRVAHILAKRSMGGKDV
jgi:glycosyltransferase involved in cell wall biosynthesis